MQRIFAWGGDSLNTRPDAEKDKNITSLWITGPSPGLQEKLARVLALQPARILSLEMPGETDTLSKSALELVAMAILHHDVRCVVVCGQPDDVPARTRTDPGSKPESESSYRQMLQRIAVRLDRQQRVQNRIRTQLNQIRAIAGIAPSLNSCAVSLCGMFYIPESDAFLLYNQAKDQFTPIAEA